jgi:hypothetical protein
MPAAIVHPANVGWWNYSPANAFNVEGKYRFVGGASPKVVPGRRTIVFRLGWTCAALALWVPTVYAQSLKPQDNGSNDLGLVQTFTCEHVKQQKSRFEASDSPRAVIVNLALDAEKAKATDLKIVHVAGNGEKFSPADVVRTWHLVTIPGRRDYNWYGMVKDKNVLMHGRLFEQNSAHSGEKKWVFEEERWLYNEEKFEKGLKTAEFQTVCRLGSPLSF